MLHVNTSRRLELATSSPSPLGAQAIVDANEWFYAVVERERKISRLTCSGFQKSLSNVKPPLVCLKRRRECWCFSVLNPPSPRFPSSSGCDAKARAEKNQGYGEEEDGKANEAGRTTPQNKKDALMPGPQFVQLGDLKHLDLIYKRAVAITLTTLGHCSDRRREGHLDRGKEGEFTPRRG